MLGLVVILSFVSVALGLACFIQYKVNQRLGLELFKNMYKSSLYLAVLKELNPELFKPKYENNVVDFRKGK